ncbi:DUF2716 domain-containing protein [Cohnella sp. CFH 77786]|uniref:DUF2716 domain-containing protein n=1 Tax=Cohnella sp. CFH 77786 TaxID=2662265 RepID=UPI001C60A7BD|nr:DUF2716 domain-containing protein [Cohnella sp. CFH 77786]MBW5449449.1 DUF2716 domain-containing protein [Cohnella sp. CFH 77786]
MNNWIKLTDKEYDYAWDLFEKRYKFKPSISSTDWPSILVVDDQFITYELSGTWDTTDDLEEKCNKVFKELTTEDEYIYALDWQHECYWYNPHLPHGSKEWTIPFYPDGDYYIFFPMDLSWCYFSHPWEKSVTLINEDLIKTFERHKPSIFGRLIRRS